MFIETRLLDCVAYGSEFGHEFNTAIFALKSGVERRNARWSAPLFRYSVLFNNLDDDDHLAVRSAHLACMGSAFGFRLKDWVDFEAVAEVIGTGDGESEQELQLIKTYTFGAASFARTINKPVADTVQLYANGVEIASDVDTETGLVVFSATEGHVITWSGEFDVPVRFDSDRLDSQPIARTGGKFILSSDVSLTEIRL